MGGDGRLVPFQHVERVAGQLGLGSLVFGVVGGEAVGLQQEAQEELAHRRITDDGLQAAQLLRLDQLGGGIGLKLRQQLRVVGQRQKVLLVEHHEDPAGGELAIHVAAEAEVGADVLAGHAQVERLHGGGGVGGVPDVLDDLGELAGVGNLLGLDVGVTQEQQARHVGVERLIDHQAVVAIAGHGVAFPGIELGCARRAHQAVALIHVLIVRRPVAADDQRIERHPEDERQRAGRDPDDRQPDERAKPPPHPLGRLRPDRSSQTRQVYRYRLLAFSCFHTYPPPIKQLGIRIRERSHHNPTLQTPNS